MNISCCFSSDDLYVPPLSALLISILDNARPEDHHSFYVFDGGISETNKNVMVSLTKNRNSDIYFVPADPAFYRELPLKLTNSHAHVTVPTYFRLSIARLIPESLDRILYFDCDMIVTASLAQLYETPLEGYYAAMVPEDYDRNNQKYYFNAGMILFNMTEIRNMDFETKSMEYWRNNRETIKDQDQGIINGLFNGNIVPLHLKWNMVIKPEVIHSHRHIYSYQEMREALDHPAIIHYTSKRKPWTMFCKHRKAELYWNSLAKTPYYSRSWHWRCKLMNRMLVLQRWILSIRRDRLYTRLMIFGKEFVWFHEEKISK